MNKFLKIKNDDLKIDIDFFENPIPILWDFKGAYGWIPIEIVTNEINRCLIDEINCKIDARMLHFVWHQTYPIRTDVGKILENLNQCNCQCNNSPQSNSPS